MTKLYLIRHGIAADRADYSNDEDRPLTEKGKQKTEQVAKCLHKKGVKFDLILTSPLVRAKATAEILSQEGLGKKIAEFAPLAPAGDIENWVNWWSKWEYNKDDSSLALVGHQPDLGNWSELFVWGRTEEKLIVKKAGVIGIRILDKDKPIGNCELFLLTSPKWLL
ncbi:phosphohistidine phosphatase, SixA [Gloeothece citriformis PCC 7424]|uniref:Phosphohistidine phosphatase, SixA n=1 Tax=Gloeothece citriformis (strain PCC 7424) TaxID=65393 RepID=B7KL89_GLOC7|nr:phosphohistidine phosphatase SixA [Gloeothece citriformis]ACK72461.1 phosphohistidine phosphatase, SixA [Gloeothece citriformis PCC 7424]